VPALDGLRGLAIFAVVLHHVPIQWHRYTHVGYAGVDLFFVLSGFLITGILLDAKGEPGALRSFYARRALRIWPLYYAFLALYYFWATRRLPLGPWQAPGWYVAHLSNVHVALFGRWTTNLALDPTWSLAVEEQFYLVWPLVVYRCSPRALVRVCVALIVAAPLLRVAGTLAGVSPIALFVLTPTHCEGLALGAAIATVARGDRGLAPFVPLARATAALVGAAFVAVWIYAVVVDLPWLAYDYASLSTLLLTPIALLCGAALVLVLAKADRPSLWTFAPLRALGRYSYAIYLFHLPVRTWAARRLLKPMPYGQLRYVATFAVTFAVSIALAIVSWHLFEKQLLKLKSRFPYRRS